MQITLTGNLDSQFAHDAEKITFSFAGQFCKRLASLMLEFHTRELSDGRRMNRPNGILLPPMHLKLKSPVHCCPTVRSC